MTLRALDAENSCPPASADKTASGGQLPPPPLPQDILAAVSAIQAGKMVIMTDDESREDEGDLVFAAQHVTAEKINFMARHACGLICLSLSPEQISRLSLPLMTDDNQSAHETPFTLSIEAASGVTTGISAFDRAHTIKVAAAPDASPTDIVSPGHIFPLRAHPQGLLGRDGHTEGALDLVKLAGAGEGAVICEIMAEDGTMMRGQALRDYAQKHTFPLLSIASLKKWIAENDRRTGSLKEKLSAEPKSAAENNAASAPVLKEKPKCCCTASAKLPDLYGGPDLKIQIFRFPDLPDPLNKMEQVALIKGNPAADGAPLVRLHSACLTGDALGSLRCDCGPQLQEALRRIKEAPCGILLYLRDHEGRGIGLEAKIKAYGLQDEGLDTVSANEALGFKADQREFSQAAEILKKLHVQKVRLMTNNPAKVQALEKCGITVLSREKLEIPAQDFNRFYLQTKKERLGHQLSLPPANPSAKG